jgi:hypothetical protein
VPPQAQAVPADSGRRSVHYEALDHRAHRCKSSAAQINLSGAALTALQRAKAAKQADIVRQVAGGSNRA